MSNTVSARDATGVDGRGMPIKRPTKVDRSRKGEPLPPINQVDEPATADEPNEDDE